MRVILVGYGEMLRALALGILNSKHEIAGVLLHDTIMSSALNRFFSRHFNPSADYLFLKNHSLKEIKAKSVNSYSFRKAVKDLKADAVITGSWSERFSIQTLNILPDGFINVHPSLLPEYRGPNPYMQAILHNEANTGVTFHLMDVNYDTGSILYQKKVPVLHNDTGGSLRLRCCGAAKSGIGFLLDNYKESIQHQKSQSEKHSSYQPQISLKEAVIEFEKETSLEIDRRIRALSPWFKCRLPVKNEFFSFGRYEITKEKTSCPAGLIIRKTQRSLYIACKDGSVMKFTDLKITRPCSKVLSKLFWDKIIKVNDRAV